MPRTRRSAGEEQAVADLGPGQRGGGGPEDRPCEHGAAWWQKAGTLPGWRRSPRPRSPTASSACARSPRPTCPRSSPRARTRRSRAGRGLPSPYTLEDADRFLAVAATEARAGAGVALAVAGAGGGALIGTVGLFELGRVAGHGEIGYWTAAAARGRGAAVRAVVLVRDWAVDALGLRELEILAHPGNVPSQRVAARAGFTDTGELRRHRRSPEPLQVFAWRAPASSG